MSLQERENLPEPELFQPSPHLDEEVNRNIIQSEIEGGVKVTDMSVGTKLLIQTQNHLYTLEKRGEDEYYISGHPIYCDEPTQIRVHGSTWGGAMLKTQYVGRGMHLEFAVPGHLPITTSLIKEVKETTADDPSPRKVN